MCSSPFFFSQLYTYHIYDNWLRYQKVSTKSLCRDSLLSAKSQICCIDEIAVSLRLTEIGGKNNDVSCRKNEEIHFVLCHVVDGERNKAFQNYLTMTLCLAAKWF